MTKVSNEALISVIVPVYNVEKYLDKCVESIVNQTYSNLEIILVDDGSIDNCPRMCDDWAKKDNRIRVIHQENKGISSTRNMGLEHARGSYISFIDSDDWVEKEYIMELYEILVSNNASVSLCSYNRVCASSKEKIYISENIIQVTGEEYLIKILNPQTGFGFCHMKLYDRKTIDNTKFNTHLKVGEDALFNEEIAVNVKTAVVLNKCLYNYRVNQNSTVRKFDPNYVNKYLESMRINKRYILKKYNSNKKIIDNHYNFIAFHVMLISVNYCFNPKNKEKNKIKLLKQVCSIDILKEAIEKCNYNYLSLTRKISMFTLKHKLYLIMALISKVRQIQVKK